MERELSPVQMRGSCPLCKNLPYRTKQRDDVISTKTKETNLATNSATRCCCVSVLTPFTVASLDHTYSLPHEADMFTRHMHSGNLKLTARGFRRLTSLCLAPCSLHECQPSNQQGFDHVQGHLDYLPVVFSLLTSCSLSPSKQLKQYDMW